MNSADALFSSLLEQRDGEARKVVLRNVTRAYFYMAADCPKVVSRWSKFFPEVAWHMALPTKIQMGVLRIFRIRPGNGQIFAFFRMLLIASKQK